MGDRQQDCEAPKEVCESFYDCPYCHIAHLEQQLRWRDVTEEPPEHLDRYYLAWGEDWGSPEKMHFNIHDGVQYWDGRNAELHYMGDSVIPTHWKPITPPGE